MLQVIFKVVAAFLFLSLECSSSYRSHKIFTPKPVFSLGIKEMKVLYGWKTVDFVFPSMISKQSMIREGSFIPGNVIILDVDYWQNGNVEKVITTQPKMKSGVPASLATVSQQKSNGSYLLAPYPDWSWHQNDNCEGIISVFRTQIDECGRLWVIDSGVTEVLEKAYQTCPPKLMAFDLKTDQLVTKYVFTEDDVSHGSLLVTIAVDVRNKQCRDTFVYVADVTNYGLVVYDDTSRRSWRVHSNYFYPYPTHGNFDIHGHQFDLMDGVIGLALSPLDAYGDRTLYFHSLASVRESKVSAALLRNSSYFQDGNNHVSHKFYVTDEVRPSQSAAQAMSEDGVLFFGLLSQLSVACWNFRLPYIASNIVEVAKNEETLEFPSGMKTVRRNGREEVWALTSRFPAFYAGVLTSDEVNFRVVTAGVDELVRGTLCDPNAIPTKSYIPPNFYR